MTRTSFPLLESLWKWEPLIKPGDKWHQISSDLYYILSPSLGIINQILISATTFATPVKKCAHFLLGNVKRSFVVHGKGQ